MTVLLHPYMPATTAKLLDALGTSGAERLCAGRAGFGSGGAGGTIGDLAPLFPKPEATPR